MAEEEPQGFCKCHHMRIHHGSRSTVGIGTSCMLPDCSCKNYRHNASFTQYIHKLFQVREVHV